MKRILLLGSGELGKEFVISCQRLGNYVIAVDSYEGAPAMHVADEFEVIDMLDPMELHKAVMFHKPDYIVPEIEAIRTEKLYQFENQGITVVPSAKAANYTMNRKAIRDLAAQELNLKTANYRYATSEEELAEAVAAVGTPCVVKPLMSSSGKGQSVIKTEADIATSWSYAVEGSRGDIQEVIVEEFIDFDHEITLLTVTQQNGETLFCPPIGHVQEGGDYQQSWQPSKTSDSLLKKAQDMAAKVTAALTGYGIWGVEFFIGKDDVYFSELSPRPHDTGMVTMAGSQRLNEFDLHARAILGLPIPSIELERPAVSSVILATENGENPKYEGTQAVLETENSEVRIFGKPTTRPGRRMGVVLLRGENGDSIESLVEEAKSLSNKIKVTC